MKAIFLYIRELLKSVPSIAWIDLDKGQLNSYELRPCIDFPAVLLKIEYPSTSKLSGKQQQCNVIITANVVYDFMDDTSNITSDETLEQSLKVYDIADEVHKKLQGAMNVTVIRTPLDLSSVRDPSRADKIKVLQYVYTTKTIE